MVDFSTDLPVYLPNAKVCRMEQYHCCKHLTSCRLYAICSQMQLPNTCRRDCPSCSFDGCTLSAEARFTDPVYVSGVIQGNRLELDLESRYWREQHDHKIAHKKKYYQYNFLFGDLKEKNRLRCRTYYYANQERCNEQIRKNYRKHHQPIELKMPDEAYLPKCGLKCEECTAPDCTLPEDWRLKALNRQRNKKYYDKHQKIILEKQRKIRQRPEVKAYRAEQNREYQRTHREKIAQKSKKWRDAHKDQVREIQRAYYAANKDIINAKRRAKRNGLQGSKENPEHREM
ncbi:MAG: hypothetical protein J6J18_09515 [Oscillospiraceae bacterium]|nr:hypothetical protein [Oscillospiraceae bacterium]